MRPRTSKLWTYPCDDLAAVVKVSSSFSSILKSIGLTPKGTSNYHRLRRRLDEEGIDYSHIKRGIDSNKGRRFGPGPKKSLEEILVQKSDYNRTHLKRRLIANGLLDNVCSECGRQPEWNGKRLVMVLDHINGVHDDNRLQNLRLLCPNCNSQMPTFSGKQHHKKEHLCRCGGVKRKGSDKCIACHGVNLRKVERPDKATLKELLWSKPTSRLAKEFGVSDKAIAKWARAYDLDKPPRGYWSKHNAR